MRNGLRSSLRPDMRSNLRAVAQWTPAALLMPGDVGAWLDPSDISTLSQDTAGTTAITAAGQSVAFARDRFGLGNNSSQVASASRQIYALNPSSGIRNVANGAAAVGDTTYWPASATHNGVTITKAATGIDTDGLPYIDYSVVGTAVGNSFIPTYGTGFSRTTASSGQSWTASALVKVVSGTIPPANCGFRFEIYGETAPSTQTEGYSAFTVVAPSAETTVVAPATLANAATNQVRCNGAIRTQDGAAVNYTIRIKALQFERGSTRSAYQFNYSAANIVEPGYPQLASLLFDGVDDFLQTSTIDFSNRDKITVIAGVRKRSDAAVGSVVSLATSPTSTNGSFSMRAPGSTSGSYEWRVKGSTAVAASSSAFPAPDTAVLTGIMDIANDTAILRRNGVQIATSAADQGTGNLANAQVFDGRDGGTTLPANMRLYGRIVINRLLTASELALAEAWMNQQTGAY